MNQLVRLRTRPSRDGKEFTYMLDYIDENGKRMRISLGHFDKRKAERQCIQLERELRMGVVAPASMKLSDFLNDSLSKTGNQVRESTHQESRFAMRHFIEVIGDVDYQRIALKHGELFRQKCLDQGNSPATVAKKLRHLKRLFQLAVDRKQLEENPLRQVKPPKSPKKKVETYSQNECEKILKTARDYAKNTEVKWDLLIMLALTTGMRRSELLNCIWPDIDFEARTITVSPKADAKETWQWCIKDTDRRTLPLTEDIVLMLANHQSQQPEGCPYVFVPSARYEHIQKLRQQNKWSFCDSRLKVVNNFGCQFKRILQLAGIKQGQFHDFRRTALSNWFVNGMTENDVMTLAGHSDFATTHQFYLAVSDDLVDRARKAASTMLSQNLARIWHAPTLGTENS